MPDRTLMSTEKKEPILSDPSGRRPLLERLGREWLFFDGGTGTILQEKGLKGGELPEKWNLSRPEDIIDLHCGYLNAGCDIFNTNTFGANALKYPEDLRQIVESAVALAKEARRRTGREDAYIALDIGPTGRLLEPLGDLPFERAVDLFGEVVRIGAAAGADLVLIETMSDSYESKAAVLAAKENCDLPVLITNVYDSTGKLLTGGTVDSTVAMLEGLRVDGLGVNCGMGPEQMIPIVKRMTETASVPILVNPNAGLPRTENGKTVYDVDPETFAQWMKKTAAMVQIPSTGISRGSRLSGNGQVWAGRAGMTSHRVTSFMNRLSLLSCSASCATFMIPASLFL